MLSGKLKMSTKKDTYDEAVGNLKHKPSCKKAKIQQQKELRKDINGRKQPSK